jgi:hypothetical protein
MQNELTRLKKGQLERGFEVESEDEEDWEDEEQEEEENQE